MGDVTIFYCRTEVCKLMMMMMMMMMMMNQRRVWNPFTCPTNVNKIGVLYTLVIVIDVRFLAASPHLYVLFHMSGSIVSPTHFTSSFTM